MHSFPRPPRSRLQKGCLGDGGVQRRSAPSSQGSNLWGIYFFFKLLQRRRRRNKAAEGGGVARDLLLSGLPLSSDASSSASLCSPPPPLFHSSTLPKVSALSFLFRQVGGEEVSGAKNDERNLSHYFLIAFFYFYAVSSTLIGAHEAPSQSKKMQVPPLSFHHNASFYLAFEAEAAAAALDDNLQSV